MDFGCNVNKISRCDPYDIDYFLSACTRCPCHDINRDFVNTRLLIHKHVKISVNKWILETTCPQKCQIFGTIYSINFQSQNQTLKDRKMKNVALFWQFADTFQPCWPCLLWTFCKLCSDWASFTKQLIRIQLLDLFGVTSTFRKRKFPDKENSFKSLKITK